MNYRKLLIILTLFIMAIPCNAQLTINIRYTGEKGAAKKYVKEMEKSGIAARIRAVEGCIRYDYFFPADDPEGLLLIDEWADQAALDRYHSSPMMKEAAALREKYKLGGRQIRMFNPLAPAPQSAEPKNPPAIDIHSHMIPDSYLDAIKAHGMEMDEGFPIPSWNADEHLKFMDEAGIQTSIITMPAPQPWFGNGDESAAICRQFNEEAAAMKAQHPGRFLFCAALPLPDVEKAIEEAKYALEVLGADGVKLASNSYGQYLGDEALEPLMAYLNSRKAVIITHPHKPSAANDILITAVPLASYEYLAETTRAILNMVAHNVLVRYPDLKVVVPHCGSFLPNALPRFKGLLPVMIKQGYMTPVDVDANISRLYFDLAGAATDEALGSLLTITEPSHILYGSDYPYVAAQALTSAKKALEARLSSHGLNPEDVFSGNAARLFNNSSMTIKKSSNMSEHIALTPRRQGLAVIAALEARGDQAGLESAIADALNSGVTVSEAKEALSQLYAYTGFPRSLNALGTMQKVLSRREAAGIKDNPGKEADPLPADYDALKQGTAVQTRLSGQPFDYNFVPATDYYLKAHLFGDIFARNNLSFSDREIVTVSAISALPGCEPQLKAHVAGALNMGVGEDELRALPSLLEVKVGLAEAERLRGALSAVLGDSHVPVQTVDFSVWPKGILNPYGQFFTGNSYLAQLDGGLANVTFEPGCRNNWHVHHGAVQVLICVAGRGWYQEWGKPAVQMVPGTVIAIPAETKHWHGAAADSWFQHLTYHTAVQKGSSNEWLEPVSDEQYNNVK